MRSAPGSMKTNVPESTPTDLWVSWEDYDNLVERLCLLLHESGWPFDHILCLARGGLRVGDVISRVFDVPLAVLSASSYRQAHGTVRGHLDLAENITSAAGPLAGQVLLVDDLVDSGTTLAAVRARLTETVGIAAVKTAVLWWKGSSSERPDYFVEYLPHNPWIHQPFETYDSLRPQQLAAYLKKGEAR